MTVNDTNTAFDRHVVQLSRSAVGRIDGVSSLTDALIAVADTAYGCKLWFESEGFQARPVM